MSKEFICRQCNTFLNTEDLEDGKCPNCKNDEDVFINDSEDIKCSHPRHMRVYIGNYQWQCEACGEVIS